jgi:hypothetical protein
MDDTAALGGHNNYLHPHAAWGGSFDCERESVPLSTGLNKKYGLTSP